MAFATIDVTKGITGTIPVANGGTGLTSGTTGQFLKFTGTTTVASSAVDAGKIGQVKTVEISTNATEGTGSVGIQTNSTSYVDVPGLTLDITPSATSSKVLLLYHASVSNTDYESNTTWSQIKVLRDSTTVSESQRMAGYMKYNHDMWTMSILDTPSSTSSLTYKVQIASGNSNTHFSCPHNNNECGITLMEVLA